MYGVVYEQENVYKDSGSVRILDEFPVYRRISRPRRFSVSDMNSANAAR